MQAPVSDREAATMMQQPSQYATNMEIARSLVMEKKEMEMMPRSAFWAPITAQRFLDLHDVQGRDDFFSSDLTDAQLEERLAHVGTMSDRRVLVAFSGKDEHVPAEVDKKWILERLCRAMNHVHPVATPLYLEHSNHNLSLTEKDSDVFVLKVADMLRSSNASFT
jgi:hypothetical protein